MTKLTLLEIRQFKFNKNKIKITVMEAFRKLFPNNIPWREIYRDLKDHPGFGFGNNAWTNFKEGATANPPRGDRNHYLVLVYWLYRGVTKFASTEQCKKVADQICIDIFGTDIGEYYENYVKNVDLDGSIPSLALPPRTELSVPFEFHPKISISRLPYTRGEFVGRAGEIRDLLHWSSQHTNNIITIIAAGGAGKTALTRKFIADIAMEKWQNYEKVFEWSFYSQGIDTGSIDTDEFFDAALSFFGQRDIKSTPIEKAIDLANLISSGCNLLILDGIEPLQHPPGPLYGRLRDVGLETLIVYLARKNSGTCLLTSRIVVSDLHDFFDKTVQVLKLENLDIDSSVKLLRTIGVWGDEQLIVDAANSVFRNPLALNLLGNWLRGDQKGDASRYIDVVFLNEDEEQGGHAKRLLERYHVWLDGCDLEVLKLLGFFERPARVDEVDALIDGLYKEGLFRKENLKDRKSIFRSISRLKNVGLLNEVDDTSVIIDGHPIIREYERSLLIENEELWKKGNEILFRFIANKIAAKPIHKSEIMKLYDAVIHAVNAKLHEEAWNEIVVPRIWQDDNYSTNTLGLISAELGVAKRFFSLPFQTPASELSEKNQSLLISQTAFLLSSSLQINEAVEIQETNFRMRVRQKLWNEATISAGSAAEYSLILGNLDKASILVNNSIEVSERGADPRWKLAALCLEGAIEHELANYEISRNCFLDAVKISKSEEAPPEWLGRASGFNYISCELDLVESQIWSTKYFHQKAEKAIVHKLDDLETWSKYCLTENEISDQTIPVYTAWFSLALGKAQFLKSMAANTDPKDAVINFHKGLQFMASSGLERFRPLAYLNLGGVIRHQCSLNRSVSSSSIAEFDGYMNQIEQLARYGPLVRYRLLAMVEKCRFSLELAIIEYSTFSFELLDEAIDLATWYKFRHQLSELEKIKCAAIEFFCYDSKS